VGVVFTKEVKTGVKLVLLIACIGIFRKRDKLGKNPRME
jgi:hypothetical protein